MIYRHPRLKHPHANHSQSDFKYISYNGESRQAWTWSYNQFRFKYVSMFVLTILMANALFAIPTWFYVKQNYKIFSQLAYDVQPALLSYLEKELFWLSGFFVISALVMLTLTSIIAFRIIKVILGPVSAVERHMKKVAQGNWSADDFKIREEDEFRSLAMSYSYLYRSIKSQCESELEQLEKIQIDPNDRESYLKWQSLIEIKQAQLGQLKTNANENAASSYVTAPKHLAS